MRCVGIAASGVLALSLGGAAQACEWHMMGLEPSYLWSDSQTGAYASPWRPEPQTQFYTDRTADRTAPSNDDEAEQTSPRELQARLGPPAAGAGKDRPSFNTTARNALQKAQEELIAASKAKE